jgi:hypothetical protein
MNAVRLASLSLISIRWMLIKVYFMATTTNRAGMPPRH